MKKILDKCILCGEDVLDGNVAYEKPCHLKCAVKAGDDKTKEAARASNIPRSGLEEKPKESETLSKSEERRTNITKKKK